MDESLGDALRAIPHLRVGDFDPTLNRFPISLSAEHADAVWFNPDLQALLRQPGATMSASLRDEAMATIPYGEMTDTQMEVERLYVNYLIGASCPFRPRTVTCDSWYATHGGYPCGPSPREISPSVLFSMRNAIREEQERHQYSQAMMDAASTPQ